MNQFIAFLVNIWLEQKIALSCLGISVVFVTACVAYNVWHAHQTRLQIANRIYDRAVAGTNQPKFANMTDICLEAADIIRAHKLDSQSVAMLIGKLVQCGQLVIETPNGIAHYRRPNTPTIARTVLWFASRARS